MKKILTSMIILASSLPAYSQFPSWKIKPNNDTIYIMDGTSIIRGDRKGKTTLWNLDGQQLYSSNDRINRFYDGRATVINKDSWEIIGFLDPDGKFTSIPHMGVAYNHPHFENGFLLGKRKGKFAMFTKDGQEQPLPELLAAYPFSNGYAVYVAYENPEKQKKPFFNYIKADGMPLERFILKEKDKDKAVEPKNVKFLSSVDSNGRSLAIVKNKLYWFDASDQSLTPILMGEESEKNRHLTLIEDKQQDFTAIGDGNLKFAAKYGKDKQEEFEFDGRLRLLSDGKPAAGKSGAPGSQSPSMETKVEQYTANGLHGLIFDGKDSIPSQFEQIGLLYADNAFVKSKGKWGVLQFVPDLDISLSINKGEDISFAHKDFRTQLRLDFPTSILSKNVRITGQDANGCSIDLESRDHKDTREGNYVIYDCSLSVPLELSDSISELRFGPVEVMCDNIKLHPKEVKAKGRYLRPFSIELVSNSLAVSQNSTEFNVILYSVSDTDGEDYPYEAILRSDTLETSCEKLSDRNHKCRIDSIAEGTYDMEFVVTETGCPPCVFPMEISCTKKGKASVRLKDTEEKDPLNDTQNNAETGVVKEPATAESTTDKKTTK